jgi:hypothetical protein
MWTVAAASGYAQGVRVKGGPASIYEHPRTSSEIIMTVPEGTVLDVLQRDGDWYWVVLPKDTQGTRRTGYIPVYLCERVGDKRIPEPGIAGNPEHSNLPAALRPKTESQVRQPRVFLGIGAAGQFGIVKFTDRVTFKLYQESGQFQADYRTQNDWALDASVGVRLGPQFVLAFGYFGVSPTTTASAVAKVPHPLNSNQPRTATISNLAVARSESDFSLQITYLVPISDRVDLALYAGPAAFYLRQDLITGFTYREAYPYDAVAIDSFSTTRKTKVGLGGVVGGDLTVMLWRFVGVGLGGRYARASLNLPSAGTGSIPVDVGGAQVNGGVRLRF